MQSNKMAEGHRSPVADHCHDGAPRGSRRIIVGMAIAVAGLAAIFGLLAYQFTSVVHGMALQGTAIEIDTLRAVRSLYTEQVVTVARAHGLEVTHNYQGRVDAIPLPATFTRELGEWLARERPGAGVRLFSDYPFPWQAEGGPRDDFERNALAALRRDPDAPYYRFETFEGRHSLRYAVADRMALSCVRCHNTHPSSPKRDWQVGEVRGVLEFIRPLDNVGPIAVASARAQVWAVLAVAVAAAGAGLTSLGLLIRRLRRSSQRLSELAVAAEAANQAKSEFLANMSHEIRTPMTAILGYAEILREDGDIDRAPQRRIESIDTIRTAGRHLMTVINDVLDLSKIEAGKMSLEKVETPLPKLLLEVDSLLQPRAREKGLVLVAQLETPLPERSVTDPTRLRQILMNLVGNAVKFTETGSVTVRVRAVETDGSWRLVIDVDDTGPGMTSEQADRLFIAFSQADAGVTRKHGGTGLGLIISRKLAHLMGGDVHLLRTAPGRGSCFRLELPMEPIVGAALVDNLDAVRLTLEDRTATSDASLWGRRILLAEDGPANQRLIAHHLKQAGADVEIAENGRIAVDKALLAAAPGGRRFDLILMDMQMPEMDGYQAARLLRRHGHAQPIIALTAHAMASDRQKCLDAGCDDYATKPIDKQLLLSTCARWCQRLGVNAATSVQDTASAARSDH